MKPRIAIVAPNSDADYTGRTLPEYKRAVEASGGEAVEISLTLTNHEVAQLAKTCDAVLLPGSPADVDPQKFNAERHPKTAQADEPRDNVDELLLQDAHNMRKPIFGICYGVQSLNVWRQGTLVQHIESDVAHTRAKGVPKSVTIRHEAVIEAGSRLAKIVGERLTVNSSHHQSVDEPGDGLRVVARSPEDGVIEAVEGTAPDHWVVGVQWHPERSFGEDEPSKKLFAEFVKAAEQWRQHARADFETVTKHQ